MEDPLFKARNTIKTHHLKVYPERLEVQTQRPTQTMRENLKIHEIEDISTTIDPTCKDPRYCTVTIKGKGRQFIEIPEMEAYQAKQLKAQIDMQKKAQQKNLAVGKKQAKASSAVRGLSLKKRYY